MTDKSLFALWMEYEKEFQTEEEAQIHLRNRMVRYIKETKTTQREIARRTKISESVISQWKNNKDIGFSADNKLLYYFDAQRLNMYLLGKGY